MGWEQVKLFSHDKWYLIETLEMSGLFGEFVLIVVEHLADELNSH